MRMAHGAGAVVYTLQQRRLGRLGLVAPDTGRAYVVGFQRMWHARQVVASVDRARPIALQRSTYEDVAHDINAGLARLGMHTVGYRSVTLDVDATLTIPTSAAAPDEESPMAMRSERLPDFLMLPFEHGVGIVIVPHTLEWESRDGAEMCFRGVHVVDPVDGDSAARRSQLARMLGGR